MRQSFTLLLLLLSAVAYAQDSIITFRGKRMPVTVIEKNGDSIRYKRSDRSDDQIYAIAKNSVWEIKHANGAAESFFTDAEKSRSMEEVKKHVAEMIDLYGYEEDSDRQKYKAVFEGDYLRLPIMVKEKVKSKGFLFDFGKVYQFHPVSERGDNEAFINIWIAFLDNPKKMKWAKQKLIMKVKGYKEAHDINRSLQLLNRMLLDRNQEHPIR